jgi:predicted alpha-1,2-mannosidase
MQCAAWSGLFRMVACRMLTCDRVDPMIGTDNTRDFSYGNALPLMALPWGTHHWSPVNSNDPLWFFGYREHRFHGLRLTHQPSPWMGDWSHCTLLPQTGTLRCRQGERTHDIASRDLTVRPHRFAMRLPVDGIAWEAAPTMHGAVMTFTFHGDGPRRLIFDCAEAGDNRGQFATRIHIDPTCGEIALRTASGTDTHAEFALHLVMQIDGIAIGGGTFSGDAVNDGVLLAEGPAHGGWLEFSPTVTTVTMRLAGSFIDEAAARRLLAQEIGDRDLNQVQTEAATTWNALLGRLQLPEADDAQKNLVASMLYRTLLFPRRIDEPDAAGKPQHRCPDTGTIQPGVRVTDNGFWDTARSVYSWYALFVPDHLPTILDGWLAGARSSGWLASWASPGHRACMTGSYADVIFADAIARGITGWNVEEALKYVRKHVEEPVADDCPYGRIGLDSYLTLGYVPIERCNKSTARTLDYAYGDWCIACIAEAAGDHAFAAVCRERAGAWRKVLDPETGFFRGRHADGSWDESFDPTVWGGPYVEGCAWQFAWHVPHNADAVIAARGGQKPALAFLEQMLREPPTYQVGTYGTTIHEMREMASVDFGQYAHSNQPSHFTLPYLAHCGATGRWRTMVHRVIAELYHATPDGLHGDEDNGEMSAWWLCAALGLVANCPGDGSWMRVRPYLRHWRISQGDGQMLEVITTATGDDDQDDVWVDPHGISATTQHLPHADLARGGTWVVKR